MTTFNTYILLMGVRTINTMRNAKRFKKILKRAKFTAPINLIFNDFGKESILDKLNKSTNKRRNIEL